MNSIELPSQVIRDFFRYANRVRTNSILPIYRYVRLKIENNKGFLCKTNQSIDVLFLFDTDQIDIDCLIEESIILDYLRTVEKNIALNIDGFNITISDGFVSSFVSQDPNLYPVCKHFESGVLVSEEIIEHISIASKHIEKNSNTWMDNVHVTSDGVMAMNQFAGYYNGLPSDANFQIALPHVVCICEFSECFFNQTESSLFFSTHNVTYRFSKSDIFSTPKYMHIVENVNILEGAVVERLQFLEYCERTKKMFDNGQPVSASIELSDGQFVLNCENNTVSKSNSYRIAAKGYDMPNIYFNVGAVGNILKSIPYKEISIHINPDRGLSFGSPDDENYKGFSSKVSFINI